MINKIFLLKLILLFSLTSLSAETLNFSKYTSKNISTEFKTAFDDLQKFSEIESLSEKDLSLVTSALEAWILVDKLDNARSAAQMLAGSYDKNKKIYQLALKKIKQENKNKILELFKILEQLNKSAQG